MMIRDLNAYKIEEVIAHELGHAIMCKHFGFKVNEFKVKAIIKAGERTKYEGSVNNNSGVKRDLNLDESNLNQISFLVINLLSGTVFQKYERNWPFTSIDELWEYFYDYRNTKNSDYSNLNSLLKDKIKFNDDKIDTFSRTYLNYFFEILKCIPSKTISETVIEIKENIGDVDDKVEVKLTGRKLNEMLDKSYSILINENIFFEKINELKNNSIENDLRDAIKTSES